MKTVIYLVNFLVDQIFKLITLFHIDLHIKIMWWFRLFFEIKFHENYDVILNSDQRESSGLIHWSPPFSESKYIVWILSFSDLRFYLFFWSKVINSTILVWNHRSPFDLWHHVLNVYYFCKFWYVRTKSYDLNLVQNFSMHTFHHIGTFYSNIMYSNMYSVFNMMCIMYHCITISLCLPVVLQCLWKCYSSFPWILQ